MKKMELPIVDSPIKYISRFYLPLMIAFQKKEEVEPWFYSSYILTKVKKKDLKFWMIYQNFNPFVYRIPFAFLCSLFIKKKYLLNILKLLIKYGWYVFTSVDLFYLKNSNCYNKKHYNHSVIVFGYDEISNKMQLCGYCFGPKITCIDVSFSEFYESFKACKHNKTWIYHRRRNVKKKFDKRFFYLGVKSYATGTCKLEYQIKAKSISIGFLEYYGVEAHRQLMIDLRRELSDECQRNIKLRIYSYWELSKCMVSRLEYLEKKRILIHTQHIKEGFIKLAENYNVMLNLFLKYKINKDLKVISKIIELEEQAYLKEKKLYSELYVLCEKQFI